MANTHAVEIVNGDADMATPAPLAISPNNGKTLLFDLPAAAAAQVVTDERPDRKMLEGTPSDVLVPPGFTIPPRVECIRWEFKSAPLKTSRGGTVFNVDDLVKRHLGVLAGQLRVEEGWLYEQWPLDTLLADLKEVGVELRIP
jgi:hypothetical protein